MQDQESEKGEVKVRVRIMRLNSTKRDKIGQKGRGEKTEREREKIFIR